MSLIERARADIKTITGNSSEFGVPMTFSGGGTATVNGLFFKHHMSVDGDGLNIIERNARVSVSEQLLLDAGYTVRSGGEVNLKKHKVTVSDFDGEKTYVINHVQPDEQLGIIVCILGDATD